MAERLNKFEFRRGCRGKYPWKDWFDGSIWKIVEGTDYTHATIKMRTHIHGQAGRKGLRACTAIVDDGKAIVFQAYPKADKP